MTAKKRPAKQAPTVEAPTLRSYAESLAAESSRKLGQLTRHPHLHSNALTLACRELDTARALLDLPASHPGHALAPVHALNALVESAFYYGVALGGSFGTDQIKRQNRKNATPDPTRGKAAIKAEVRRDWDALSAAEKGRRGAGAEFDRDQYKKHPSVEQNTIKKWREDWSRADK
jgi:hypothetical protein